MKDQQLTLEKLLKVLFKNAILIIVLALIGGGSFYMLAKHKQSKSYVAERSMVIDHNLTGRRAHSLFETDLSMVPTYRDLIEGREVTDNAYHRLPKRMWVIFLTVLIQIVILIHWLLLLELQLIMLRNPLHMLIV